LQNNIFQHFPGFSAGGQSDYSTLSGLAMISGGIRVLFTLKPCGLEDILEGVSKVLFLPLSRKGAMQ
jgi:hypothetical protein